MKVFILAGGAGTRLWPYSKTALPKQFLFFGSEHSLLQKTFLRFIDLVPPENITVVTQEDYFKMVEAQIGALGYSIRIRSEPERRNTGPAIAWLVKDALDEGFLQKEDLFFISPSDHYFSNVEELHRAIFCGMQQNAMCLFGIPPRRAETGYGYVEAAKSENISKVVRFIEKPNHETAKALITSNKIYWNSGMFLFHTGHFLQELEKHAPKLMAFIQGKIPFSTLPKISIDYALMEHTTDALLIRLNLTWSDIGSWDGVYEAADKDAQQNVLIGEGLIENSSNCLVCSTHQKVVLSHVHDLMVLVSDTEIIVADRSTDVKSLQCKPALHS